MSRILTNPGSKEAIEVGCRCPVSDNAQGNGIELWGELMFWYSSDCPVHRNEEEEEDDVH